MRGDGRGPLLPLLLFVAAACLLAGLFLPILQARTLFLFAEGFSIADGILRLWVAEAWLTAGVIALFSLVLPGTKLILLFVFWLRLRRGRKPPAFWLALLDGLGKWSMLDVFVVALVIFGLQAGSLTDASVGEAVAPFTAAVLLTAFCSWRLRSALRRQEPTAPAPIDGPDRSA